LALLDAALDAFLNEVVLASIPPPIPYSPRVPNWRAKRVAEPARYWWQGLSPDRFDEARSLFLRSPTSANESFELVPVHEFCDTYRTLYDIECPDKKRHQALGLLANGFFGFTPRSRPVLWRVIVCHSRLYHASLGNMEFDPNGDAPNDLVRVFLPRNTETFPFAPPLLDEDELYEPFAATMAATTSYLSTFVVPRLAATLTASAIRENVDRPGRHPSECCD
jgi:hypothetical protein